jgi:hypothetical protein
VDSTLVSKHVGYEVCLIFFVVFVNFVGQNMEPFIYGGDFCPAIGSTEVISVPCQLRRCALPYQRWHRQGFLGIQKIKTILGIPPW